VRSSGPFNGSRRESSRPSCRVTKSRRPERACVSRGRRGLGRRGSGKRVEDRAVFREERWKDGRRAVEARVTARCGLETPSRGDQTEAYVRTQPTRHPEGRARACVAGARARAPLPPLPLTFSGPCPALRGCSSDGGHALRYTQRVRETESFA
jgi:hypothetical protein